jgi:predicted aldo/keto reductase-like oxidoreductase
MAQTLALAGEAVPGMLGEDEVKLVERVRDAYQEAGAVGCTGCRYCVPCPFGVSIPEVFDWYNEWKTIRHTLPQKMFYLSTVGGVLSGKSGLASKCTSCGVCLEKCPQSLPIPDLMKGISKEYEGGLGKVMDGVGSILYKRRNRGLKKTTKPDGNRKD